MGFMTIIDLFMIWFVVTFLVATYYVKHIIVLSIIQVLFEFYIQLVLFHKHYTNICSSVHKKERQRF